MIIYRRKDNDVVIPCGLGPVVCPDTSHNLQMKTVDSSTVLQHVEPDSGYYGLYRVIVNPIYDANLLAENIKNGVTILGVMGTYAGTVLNLQAKSVNPSTELQVVTFDQPYNGLSSVTVNPVTADIDPDILAENIKKGVEILGVTGTFEGGPLQSKSVNSSTSSQSVTPDPSYYGLSSVTVNPYTVESKTQTITQNGTYSFAPASADALSDVSISVEVASTPATVQAKSVSYNANGEYTVTPDQGYDGLSSVDISVNVPAAQPTLQTKTVNSSTASQTVQSDGGYDGLSEVIVNPYVLDRKTVNPSINRQVVTSDEDGLSRVTVNAMTLQSKDYNEIGAYGTYYESIRPDYGYDGLSEVRVLWPSFMLLNVNSSTSRQTFYPEVYNKTYFKSVAVEPYTVETNSSTLTQNGQYTFSPVSADALSSVTVNVSVDGGGQVINNQNKTVNSSTSSQNITADQGYTGLGTVTVNPYTLDTKTVNPSTNSITVNSSADGMSSVTVNAVTASIDPDIVPGNIKKNVEILGVIGTYDGSSNWIMDTKKGVITDLVTDTEGLNEIPWGLYSLFTNVSTLNSVTFTNSSANSAALAYVCNHCQYLTSGSFPNLTSAGNSGLRGVFQFCPNLSHVDFPELTTVQESGFVAGMEGCCTNSGIVDASVTFPKLTDVGKGGMTLGFRSSGFSSVSFPVLTRVAFDGFREAFHGDPGERCVQDVSFPNLAVCDYDYYPGIVGFGAFHQAFRYNDSITSLSFPSLTTGIDSTFDYAFSGCSNLTSISLPLFTSPISPSSIDDCSVVSITAHPLAIGTTWLSDSSYDSYNEGVYKTNMNPTLTTVTLTQDASDNISFSGCSALSAATVLHILEHLDLTVSGKTCTFYSRGLSVEDDAQGSIQNAYDTAVNAGWTIINLIIMPHGATVNYVTSIEQPNSQDVVMTIPEVYSRDTVLEMDYFCPDTTGDSPLGGYTSGYMCRIIFNLDVLGSTATVIDYDRDGNTRTMVNDSYTVGARHTLELDQYNGGTHQMKISVDGRTVATAVSAKTTVHDLSNGAYFDLFKIDNSYTQPGFTYYGVKWYEYVNGAKTLVHDYRPALDTNNVPGFYDEVTQQYLVPTSGTLDYTA